MTPASPAAQPELAVAPASALTSAERAVIVALCSAAFEEDFSWLFDRLPDSTHVLARLDGQLVSHACWVTRWLQPAGLAPLRTAYVEAVATAPVHRERGLGSQVMRRLAEEARDYELAALSPAFPAFYERLGWSLWRGPTGIRAADGPIETPEALVMVLALPRTPPLDPAARLTAEWRPGELW